MFHKSDSASSRITDPSPVVEVLQCEGEGVSGGLLEVSMTCVWTKATTRSKIQGLNRCARDRDYNTKQTSSTVTMLHTCTHTHTHTHTIHIIYLYPSPSNGWHQKLMMIMNYVYNYNEDHSVSLIVWQCCRMWSLFHNLDWRIMIESSNLGSKRIIGVREVCDEWSNL